MSHVSRKLLLNANIELSFENAQLIYRIKFLKINRVCMSTLLPLPIYNNIVHSQINRWWSDLGSVIVHWSIDQVQPAQVGTKYSSTGKFSCLFLFSSRPNLIFLRHNNIIKVWGEKVNEKSWILWNLIINNTLFKLSTLK